ncbi:hypothetical protein CHLRE_12g516717v5 [Chlamydomonas reinhardtii]|uniref:Uncharacterized protein n=1 Tax=Chlamydomonas reinhardtii TaxID=3055 RepID=A0A2K3D3S7_CHLRE|nr:uncharacterized protein CHLRE_12g516717v5 [Chlamydomonas reinhardtii]XP_042918408.1 uncharacterized protein CHLRE_12g516717v5 [Chlamydomonas reinhardtii]PNW75193.1 hypothetical protein CHLRE_12g516717v5 [Chlamydomonas reinhardtii]PNW75194.1 hypothetical protein CHLRE_12g516717v5 [Chlamydomonas reinhardtii]
MESAWLFAGSLWIRRPAAIIGVCFALVRWLANDECPLLIGEWRMSVGGEWRMANGEHLLLTILWEDLGFAVVRVRAYA